MMLHWKERASVCSNYGSDVVLANEVNKQLTNNSAAPTDNRNTANHTTGQADGTTLLSSGREKSAHLVVVLGGCLITLVCG